MNNAIRKKPQYVIMTWLLQFLLFCVFLTCRWKIHNIEVLNQAREKSRPILICCWHSRFVLVSRFFKKIHLPLWAVSSTHADSEILANVLKSWKIKLIRGSSTRGWINIIKQMVVLYKKTFSIITITPDGPLGPRKQAKPGAFHVAKKYNTPVFLVAATATRFWSLPSWDQTRIPKPFSTVYIRFSSLSTKNVLDSAYISQKMNQNQKTLINDIKNN